MIINWAETVRYYLWLVQRDRKRFFFGIGCVLFLNLYQLVPPLVIGLCASLLAGALTSPEKLSRIMIYSVALGGSFALVSYLRVRAKSFVNGIRNLVGLDIRSKGFHQVLRRSLVAEEEIGAVVSQKINAGAEAFYNLTGLLYNELFKAGVLSSALVILLLINAPLLVIPTALYLAVFYVLANHFGRKIGRIQVERAKATEASGAVVANTLAGARTIGVLGKSSAMHEAVASKAARVYRFEQELRNVTQLLWQLFQGLNGFFIGLMLFGIGYLNIYGAMSLTTVVALIGYVQNLVSAQTDVLDVWEKLQQVRAALGRLADVYRPSDVPSAGSTDSQIGSWQTIELDDVSYRYPKGAAHALSHFSLALKRGERMALLGPSGAGKTTAAKLLIGALSPTHGRRLVDGAETKGQIFSPEFALALQECQIFNLSVKENLTLCQPVAEDLFERIMQITRLDSVAAKLPDGFDTQLGEGAAQLSGGEMQRLSLARALLMKPTLLILDEATAMVEGELEEKLFEEIFSLFPETAVVLITHHERPLKYFNRAVRLSAPPT